MCWREPGIKRRSVGLNQEGTEDGDVMSVHDTGDSDRGRHLGRQMCLHVGFSVEGRVMCTLQTAKLKGGSFCKSVFKLPRGDLSRDGSCVERFPFFSPFPPPLHSPASGRFVMQEFF